MFAYDRAEIINVKAVGVVAPVPTNDVKWVVRVGVRVHAVNGFDANFETTHFIVCHGHLGRAEISLAIRSMLKKLRCLLRDVPLRRKNVGAVCSLCDEVPVVWIVFALRVEHHAVDRALWNDDEVTRAELQRAEYRVQRASAVVNVQALIGLSVLVVVVHRAGRHTNADLAVSISKQHGASGDWIACRFRVECSEMPHSHDI